MKFLILNNTPATYQEVADWLEKCKAAAKPFILVIHKADNQANVRWNCESFSPEMVNILKAHKDTFTAAIESIYLKYADEESRLVVSYLTCSVYNLSQDDAGAFASELYHLIIATLKSGISPHE